MPREKIILIRNTLITDKIFDQIKSLVRYDYDLIESTQLAKVFNTIRSKGIKLVIMVTGNNIDSEALVLKNFKFVFPAVSLLAVIGRELELAGKCGELGIGHVVCQDNLEALSEVVERCLSQRKVMLSDLGINPSDCKYSGLLQQALQLIDNDYILLCKVKEIADILNVDECTLIREFHRFGLNSCKSILYEMKVVHAHQLLKYTFLKLKEVANLAGFLNERQFQNVFSRKYGVSPALLRKKANGCDVPADMTILPNKHRREL